MMKVNCKDFEAFPWRIYHSKRAAKRRLNNLMKNAAEIGCSYVKRYNNDYIDEAEYTNGSYTYWITTTGFTTSNSDKY